MEGRIFLTPDVLSCRAMLSRQISNCGLCQVVPRKYFGARWEQTRNKTLFALCMVLYTRTVLRVGNLNDFQSTASFLYSCVFMDKIVCCQ